MRLLDRYLLRELLLPLGYCLGGFLIFWIAFDLFNQLGAFQANKLKGLDVAEYYLFKTPEVISFPVMPAALLLALLYALTNHARHHELVAMRAAGVGVWRLGAPYLAVGAGLSLALFALNELVVPDGNERAEAILNRYKEKQAETSGPWQKKLSFNNDRDRRSWNIEAYNLDTHEMIRPNVEWTRPDGTHLVLFAERAQHTHGVWTFFNVQPLDTYAPGQDVPLRLTTNMLAFPEFTETPRLIKSEVKISGMSSYRQAKRVRFSLVEIFDYRRLHPVLKGDRRAELDTQLHGRLAIPWTCLVVVLIAMPFTALSGRQNVWVGVAGSIFICFAFFILTQSGLALGTSGRLPPWLGAWLPHLVFGGGGVWLTKRLG
jgi:lipopolysaccharide export system permease protein